MKTLKPFTLPNGSVLDEGDVSPDTVVAVVWKDCAAGTEHRELMKAVKSALKFNMNRRQQIFTKMEAQFDNYYSRRESLTTKEQADFIGVILEVCIWHHVITGEPFKLAGIDDSSVTHN